MFTSEQDATNIYDEYCGVRYTCHLCGRSWVVNRNDDYDGHKCGCTRLARITEWDGSTAGIAVVVLSLDEVEMIYQDGERHTVSSDYFKSILKFWL